MRTIIDPRSRRIECEQSKSQQSGMLQIVLDQTSLLIRCGLRTNQAKAGGHVIPKTPELDGSGGYAGMDSIVDDDLKELIGTTYTNKMHLLFSSILHKNSIVKHVWHGVVMGWVTFWKVSQKACE